MVKILLKPELGRTGSILQKGQKQNNHNFKLDALTEQVDDIRVAFRRLQLKMEDTLVPIFESDIEEMIALIEE